MRKLLNKLQSRRKKGFTLLEVLVVVIILGVLALIAVPTYNKVIKKSRVSDGLNVLDMLAGAQDKYFIQHGMYAQSLSDLNAPFKEHRTGGPFQDIQTTNFTYNKTANMHCIEAHARIGGSYTLVKNYRDKGKTVCMGADCGDISDYVNESTGSLSDLCPPDNSIGGCQPPAGGCPSGEIWAGEPICSCIGISAVCLHQCDPATYQNTTVQTNTECSNVEPGPEYGTGSSKQFKIDSLVKKQAAGTKTSGGSGGGNEQVEGCGLITYTKTCELFPNGKYCEKEATHCYTKNCKALFGEGYHLAGPNYPGHNKCDCVKECDQNVPHGVADICGTNGSCSSIQICDPCSSSSQQGQQGGNDRGGDILPDSCCGWQKTDHNTVECNLSTGEWECVNHADPCNEVPSDAGKPCDGTSITPVDPHIVEGNQCGIMKITQCKINDSCSGADAITSCELKGSSACFEGQISTEGCENGEQKVCGSDCKWSDCGSGSGCDPNNKLTPGQTDVNGNTNIRACHIKDGIEDEDKFCGTETTNKQECDENGNWYWDFTDVECANVQEKPDSPPQTGSGSYLCYAHEGIRECTLSGNQYYWNQTGWTDWHLKAGANCGTIGQILGGTENFPIFCSEFCKAAKCKLPYFYNAKLKACYSHQTKVAVIATVVPATPATSNATGEVKKWAICGPIEQGTNYNGSNCLRTCKTVDEYTIKTTVFDNGEDYCYNTDDQGIAVDIENIPETVHPCTYNWPYTKVWNKGKQYTAYKCLRGGVANYQFVSYP